jgi:hypothetical protein
LWQQARGAILGGVTKEDGAETEAAANRFFQDAQAFDGAVSGFGEFGAGEGQAQLLDQGVVPSLDAAESLLRAGTGF